MRKNRRRQAPKRLLVLSGKDWVLQFPTSKVVEDCQPPFRENCAAFLAALKEAGADVIINATYRPPERAYLMHYAYRVARDGVDPRNVPLRQGIDIDWVHRKANNQVDYNASKNAAEEMVQAYGIVYRPALYSQHTKGLAIDMNVSWTGTLSVKDRKGKVVNITSGPRTGQNSDLHAVGKTYGVVKLATDPPHWSADGTFRITC